MFMLRHESWTKFGRLMMPMLIRGQLGVPRLGPRMELLSGCVPGVFGHIPRDI